MMFDSIKIIGELERNILLFNNLLKGIPSEEYLWKKSKNKWCLLEIVCHLLDEEREDFRKRLRHILENLKKDFDPIDPVGWVQKRDYLAKDYNTVLQQFLSDRNESIKWLNSLENPNWKNEHRHPTIGIMTAKLMLSNWLAHDYLHLRQIIKVKFDYLKQHTKESLSYAGDW